MEAYAQLAAEGYLVSQPGRADAGRRPRRRRRRPRRAAGEPPAPRFDFRPGAPDVSLFPRTAWAAALRQALRDAPDARFSYSDPRGTPELRRALATYLGRVRGVAADPETVMVTSGLTQGLVLTCRALAARGVRRVAVEEPGQRRPARRRSRRPGWNGSRSPSTATGSTSTPSSAATWARCSSRPAHQYPTGVVLAPERRAALLAWAADARRLRARGRLRRRVPLRPPAGRGAAGPRPAARGLHELDQQDGRAGAEGRLARRAAGAGRGDRAREARRRPRHAGAHAARARRSCSSAASSTATSAARGSSTGAGATRSSPPSSATCPSCARTARPPGCTCSSTCPPDVDEGALVRGRRGPRRRARRPRARTPPAPTARP